MVTVRHLRAVDTEDRQEQRGAEVLKKLQGYTVKRRQETERELLRSLARGLRAGPSIDISSDLLAEKFDSMAEEVE